MNHYSLRMRPSRLTSRVARNFAKATIEILKNEFKPIGIDVTMDTTQDYKIWPLRRGNMRYLRRTTKSRRHGVAGRVIHYSSRSKKIYVKEAETDLGN